MTICEYCIDLLFSSLPWQPRIKNHHDQVDHWEYSYQHCSICHSLLEAVREALHRKINPATLHENEEQYHKEVERISSLKAPEVLAYVQPHLPIYNVFLQEPAARHQFMLLFRPVEEDCERIGGLELPDRNFLVFSKTYDSSIPPRLESSTSIDLQPNKTVNRTLNRIKAWLNDCDDNHSHCNHLFKQRDPVKIPVPTRLIKVDAEQSPPHVRLVETLYRESETESPELLFAKYATLSHCWGYGLFKILTRDNLKSFQQCINLDETLPQNFRDAIHLARALGIEYIWIDSLCIIQKDASDWEIEAARMHLYYGHSYLNIAAACARTPSAGFYRRRRINTLSPSIVPVNWHGQQRMCKVIRDDFWSGELLSEPLYRRAWVFQERMLSPRTIHFGSQQIFWQCLTMTACETMPDGVPKVVQDAGREELQWRRLLKRNRVGELELEPYEKIELQGVWRDAVRNYTSCDITFVQDKLPAIAGLAQAMNENCGEKYVAGLWHSEESSDFVEQLAWRVESCRTADGRPSRRQGWDADSYRAPSWAWPSVDGMVELPKRVRQEGKYVMELGAMIGQSQQPLLEYDNVKKPYMRLKWGKFVTRGFVYNVTFTRERGPDEIWTWQPETAGDRPWCRLHPDEPLAGADVNEVRREFPILLLFYSRTEDFENDFEECFTGKALALRVESQSGTYSRIGLVDFKDLDQERWDLFRRRLHVVVGDNDFPALITLI